MPKSPLERAARALCELAGNPPGATMGGKPLWMDYLPEVRAVVEAIREPSEDMKSAPVSRDGDWSSDRDIIRRGMIDALLAEGE